MSFQQAWGGGINQGGESVRELLIERQTAIAQTPAVIMYMTPRFIPYQPLMDLLVAPITFIPRLVWPTKPNYTITHELVTVSYLGSMPGTGSAAVTMAGNVYMYGGWMILVLGMAALGALSAIYYARLVIPGLKGKQTALIAVYAATVVTNFHIGEGDFVSVWQGIIQRTVVFLSIAYFLSTNHHTRQNFNTTPRTIRSLAG